jgi:hypothetical protein
MAAKELHDRSDGLNVIFFPPDHFPDGALKGKMSGFNFPEEEFKPVGGEKAIDHLNSEIGLKGWNIVQMKESLQKKGGGVRGIQLAKRGCQ